jgi:GNAT superfamily N-acetyltransferase
MADDLQDAGEESRHFGLAIGRCRWRQPADIAAARAAGRARRLQLLVARCAATDPATIHAATAAGALLCDVLLTFSAAAAAVSAAVPADLTLRPAAAEDTAAVVALARAAFVGYPGHYRQDPRIDAAAADGLYPAWAVDLAGRAAQPTTPLLLAERSGALLGFCALQQLPDGADVRLLAVAQAARGCGVSDALLAAAALQTIGWGLPQLYYTTQLANLAAQRAVQRCGLRSSSADLTFHLWCDEQENV